MATFDAPPTRTAFPQEKSTTLFAWPWIKWFNAVADRFNSMFQNPPVVTGSRGGNAALASLLTALEKQGYIKDSTTT